MHSNEALRRAQALFRKEQQAREGQQAMAEYQAKLDAMREKTARLRELRLARDAARPVRRVRRSLSIFRVSDNPLALANEVIELKRRKFITLLGGAAVARGRSQGRASAPIERS